jgi:tetratricopeptide (TPR) repeat protein
MPGLSTNNMALLRLADKLVRDGDHKGALTAILKAREMDPANRYAEAYEERVRALMTEPIPVTAKAPGEAEQAPEIIPPVTAAPSSRLAEIVALLDQANAAIMRSDFPEALEYIGKARQLDPDNGDVVVLEEEIRGVCDSASPTPAEPVMDFDVVLSTLDAYTSEAMELMACGEFDEALHLVTKGFVLAPANEKLREAEEQILAARRMHEAQKEAAALAAEHYHRLVETERIQREELAHHLDCARTLLRNGALDDALTEVALGYTIDPQNDELHEIEQAVWQEKAASGALSESPAKHEEVARLIRLHILAAEEFAKNGDFVKALDGLAKAYVIDPANTEIKRAEVRIRQAELRHHQASGSPLKLVYHHDRVVNGE